MNQASNSSTQADLRVRTYLTSWWHALTSLDGPTWRALRKLATAPGALSAEQLLPTNGLPADGLPVGSRAHPIRLYLTANILFFLLAPWINSSHIGLWKTEHALVVQSQPALADLLSRAVERSGIEDRTYRAVLDLRMSAQQGALAWLLIPFLAFGSFAVCRRRRRFLVEHLVLATNLMSYLLLSLLLIGLIGRGLLLLGSQEAPVRVTLVVVILGWLGWSLRTSYKSLRFFFDLSAGRAALLTLWQGAAFSLGFMIYLQALLLVSLISLRGLTLQ